MILPDPFFIVYKARSGSTFLADLLTSHPQICVTPDSNLVPVLLKWSNFEDRVIQSQEQLSDVMELVYSDAKFADWNIPRGKIFTDIVGSLPFDISTLIKRIVFEYSEGDGSPSIYGIKKGGWYAENIHLLRKFFPRTRFILLIRDGRAIYASAKKALHSLTGRPFERDPIPSALKWREVASSFEKWEGMGCALKVRYEELIRKPDVILREVVRFLGAESDEALIERLLQPHSSTYVQTRARHLHPNVGKLPQISRIDAWREELSIQEIKDFERIAGGKLEKEGYSLTYTRSLFDELYALYVIMRVKLYKWRQGAKFFQAMDS